MDWPTVIKNLHDEAARDGSRSADALAINRDQMSAMVFSISSVICNRLAKALEAGLLNSMPPLTIEDEPAPKAKIKKGGRSSKNPTFLDKEFKAKRPRGRPRKDAA